MYEVYLCCMFAFIPFTFICNKNHDTQDSARLVAMHIALDMPVLPCQTVRVKQGLGCRRYGHADSQMTPVLALLLTHTYNSHLLYDSHLQFLCELLADGTVVLS